MKLYRVETLKDYEQIVASTLESGLDNNDPLFKRYDDFLNFFDVPDDFTEMFYDDNGKIRWDYEKNILPKNFLNEFLPFRLKKQLGYSLPMYIVINGMIDHNDVGYKTFYEIQNLSYKE